MVSIQTSAMQIYTYSSHKFKNISLNKCLHIICDLPEQSTEIQDNAEALSRELVTQLSEVEETSLTSSDVKDNGFVHMVSSGIHGQ